MTTYQLAYAASSAAILSALLPVCVGLWRWRALSQAAQVFVLALVIELGANLGQFLLAQGDSNNHWVAYALTPIESTLIVAALALWQDDATSRRWMLRAAPVMLLAWFPPLLGWENRASFSLGTDTLQAAVCLAVAAYTVIRRWVSAPEDAGPQDWAYIGAGVMLYSGTYALVNPLNNYLLGASVRTVLTVLIVGSGFQVLANTLYYLGVRCSRSQLSSGHSSWPSRWWSPFSWWPSPPR